MKRKPQQQLKGENKTQQSSEYLFKIEKKENKSSWCLFESKDQKLRSRQLRISFQHIYVYIGRQCSSSYKTPIKKHLGY